MERLCSTSSVLMLFLFCGSAAQAQVAEAPAAAGTNASAAAGEPNPLGGTGFITVQGNKFVDANCKVSAPQQMWLS